MQHYFLHEHLKLNSNIVLPHEVAHHWISVVRAQLNDQAEFVDNKHQVYLGKLVQKDPESIVKIVKYLDVNTEMPVKVSIACGLPKKNKADLITQKAVEMGVFEIIFFKSQWSIAKWRGNRVNKKLKRLNKIAKSAAEQSHRNIIPKVEYIDSLTDLLKLNFDKRMVAYEESAKQGERTTLKMIMNQMKGDNTALTIFGPEGGISPSEIKQMISNGVAPIGLGPRILRTETAPLYLLAAFSTFFELKE
ncbi:ribosomal RNA small subunit methyltransferase E [Philodulcilactobacillus myokoensis]|uniref:Ribosomal RNA small subunit methyltransferase E n=1 Tax=Philodulcilactobacillus myokoensis TaxID=2929573 RepID=A0A9W6ESD5_9LACO|nr:16S rRNA (uracil(1498)-N(3))-methyltransferase [Philodulcilactobacillus myokoensis]GLB46926.1 ribosomal RNA small subunit methyltransferase E [Philodulcilactobacillus myokoensis]